MKKKRLYKLLLFDVIALAVIFVAFIVIKADLVTDIFVNKEKPTYSFADSLVKVDSDSQIQGNLSQAVGAFEKQVSNNTDDKKQDVNSNPDNTNMDSKSETDEIIHMTVAGDVLFSASPLNKYDSNDGIKSILSKHLLKTMNDADINFINLEFPFSTRGTKMEDKQYTFRADPKRCSILHEMGVNVVTLANNHILDYGIDALNDTLTTLKAEQILAVGAGKNLDEAKQAASVNIKGKSIAFLGGSRKIPVYSWGATANSAGVLSCYDPTALCDEIKIAKQTHDFVVVYVHWGDENQELPLDYQRNNGKQYIDAGADLVIGSHPHILQGIEYYNGKPIVYSLGNFVFGHTIERTALLEVTIDENNKCGLRLIPCSAEQAYTHEMSDPKKIQEFYKYFQKISFGITVNENGEVVQD